MKTAGAALAICARRWVTSGLDRDGTLPNTLRFARIGSGALPPAVDFRFASLLEPVAVCLEAIQRARIAKGDTVLVIGDGPFGIIIARLAIQRESRRVILVGRHDFRLRQVPGAVALNEKQNADVPAAIREASGAGGIDAAILATGSPAALELALGSLRARGRLVVFSAIHGTPNVDWFRIHTQEIEIAGACNDQDLIDPALNCLADPELQMRSTCNTASSVQRLAPGV